MSRIRQSFWPFFQPVSRTPTKRRGKEAVKRIYSNIPSTQKPLNCTGGPGKTVGFFTQEFSSIASATSPSPTLLGCSWLYRKWQANSSSCTLRSFFWGLVAVNWGKKTLNTLYKIEFIQASRFAWFAQKIRPKSSEGLNEKCFKIWPYHLFVCLSVCLSLLNK